jgi:hypothetical protein
MYDSINVSSLPAGADVYAGYDDGRWPDAAAIAAKYPGKPVVRITVNPNDMEGDCLDVENGDASPDQAPLWVARRRQAGHTWATVYCSLSAWPAVQAAFRTQGIAPPHYWVAAYPGNGQSLYVGAIAHQWIDHGPYDESVVAVGWPPVDPPVPPGPPVPLPSVSPRGDNVQLHTISFTTDANGNGAVVCDNGVGAAPGISSVPVTIPWSDFCGVSIQGSDPAADNGYWNGTAHVQDRGGYLLITVTGFLPKEPASVFVLTSQ